MILTQCRRLPFALTLVFASLAHAGQLSVRFAGGGNEVELAPGETTTIDVAWTMAPTDTAKSGAKLTAVELRLNVNDSDGTPLAAGLTVESVAGLSGWDLSGTIGIGGPFSEPAFFVSASDPSGAGVAGNGTSFETLVASLVLRSSGASVGNAFVTLRHNSPTDPLPLAYKGAAAWSFKWQEEVSGANQFDLGVGNPGDAGPAWDPDHGYESFLPLTIYAGLRDGCPVPQKAIDLQDAYPGLQIHADPVCCDIKAFYGRLMTEAPLSDPTPAGAAQRWLDLWAREMGDNVFDINGLILQPHPDRPSNQVGFGRSTVFAYQQYMPEPDGDLLPVRNAFARLVVMHGVGGAPHRVAYVAAKLCPPPAGGFRSDALDAGQALDVVQNSNDYRHLTEWSTPELVIYHQAELPAVRAWEFMGGRSSPPESYTFFVDAADGAVIAWDELYDTGLSGHVRGYATPGDLPDVPVNPEVITDVPGIGVRRVGDSAVGGNETFSGPGGNYALPYYGPGPETLRADLFGQWVTVVDLERGDLALELMANPGTETDFTFNAERTEFATAQINALIGVTRAHDFYKGYQPDFPGIDMPLRCEVNENDACNAYFDPMRTRLIFFKAGSKVILGTTYFCPNTAYGTTLPHEYGHFVVNRLQLAGPQGAFGEGFADSLAVLLNDDPVHGEWFLGEGTFTRRYSHAPKQYPCADPFVVHECGEVLAGCWWDLRRELGADLGEAEGLERARQLFTDWSQFTLGGGGPRVLAFDRIWENGAHSLTPVEALVADDLAYGDGDMANGTPHDCAICLAFAAHGVVCPPVVLGDQCVANDIPDRCEPDCNGNGTADSCDVIGGLWPDCTGNGVPDSCEPDCNFNGFKDSCEIAAGTSPDCTNNGIPDECEPDCNGNGTADSCEIQANPGLDCPLLSPCACDPPVPELCGCLRPGNGVLDSCEADCDGDGTPNSCAIARDRVADCNANGVPDGCDLAAGTSNDCNVNGNPDECETDCNGNDIPDGCDIAAGTSPDCGGNGVPDECGTADCNLNSVFDECDIADGTSEDCDGNSTPDECDLAAEPSADCPGDPNGIPDECEFDCNFNGTADSCDIAMAFSEDCDGNEVPDECDLVSCESRDCNGNAILDDCDIAAGTSPDMNLDGVPDECLPPPVITAIASVGYHAPFAGWPGGEIALCIDPEQGAIEPRVQTPTTANGNTQVFLRVTFDQPMDVGSLSSAGMSPNPGVTAEITQPVGSSETIEIRFKAVGTAAEVPAGSYTIDVAGVESLVGGVRAGGACASFPICFATGDVNCDGRTTYHDIDNISANLGRAMNHPQAEERADTDRDGIISGLDEAAVVVSHFLKPRFPATCACSCAPVGQCDTFDCNDNALPDVCELEEGSAYDCNDNETPDECDIGSGVSVDCNLNGVPDECDTDCNGNGLADDCECSLADDDVDGDTDLFEFAGFQVCFNPSGVGLSTACDCTFDLEPPPLGDGDVDLADWQALVNLIDGPQGGCVEPLLAGSGGGEIGEPLGDMASGSPQSDSNAGDGSAMEPPFTPDPWWHVLGFCDIEVRPTGGGEAVGILTAHTAYDVYYLNASHPVAGYTLITAGTSPEPIVDEAFPPASGDWAGSGVFGFAETTTGETAPVSYPYRIVMDDLPSAPSDSTEGWISTLTPQQTGQLELHLMLYWVDWQERATYETEVRTVLIVVEEVIPPIPSAP